MHWADDEGWAAFIEYESSFDRYGSWASAMCTVSFRFLLHDTCLVVLFVLWHNLWHYCRHKLYDSHFLMQQIHPWKSYVCQRLHLNRHRLRLCYIRHLFIQFLKSWQSTPFKRILFVRPNSIVNNLKDSNFVKMALTFLLRIRIDRSTDVITSEHPQ